LLLQNVSFAESKDKVITDAPRIFIPEKIKDFGDVAQGSILEHEFEIQNKGTKDLIIRSLNPACGCTAAVINDPVVKPGSKSQIRLSFNTVGFRGSKEKILRIYSNDPLDSSEVVSVKANILQDVEIDPEVLELGEIVRSKGFKNSVTIKSSSSSALKIEEIISKSSFIGASAQQGQNGAILLSVFSKDQLPLGSVRTRLVVRTDSKATPILTIPISFYVVGDLTASPKSVNFGFVKSASGDDSSLSRVIRINRISEAQNTQVDYVEKSNREIDADLSEDASGQYVKLHINSLAKGVMRGVVRLYTDSEQEDEKVLEVPYFAVVDSDAR